MKKEEPLEEYEQPMKPKRVGHQLAVWSWLRSVMRPAHEIIEH